MGCAVILTDRAQWDLEEIVAYIARENPDRARSFGHELLNRALSLSNFPKIGREVPELGDPEVREIFLGSYRIVYEVLGDPPNVYVLRFWHAARGTPKWES